MELPASTPSPRPRGLQQTGDEPVTSRSPTAVGLMGSPSQPQASESDESIQFSFGPRSKRRRQGPISEPEISKDENEDENKPNTEPVNLKHLGQDEEAEESASESGEPAPHEELHDKAGGRPFPGTNVSNVLLVVMQSTDLSRGRSGP